jgi:hypothetical protein
MQLDDFFPFPRKELDSRFKYLGFFFKPNGYKFIDLTWLYKKFEVCVALWVNQLFSRGGRLMLLKSILESIFVYWTSIVVEPKGILTKIK